MEITYINRNITRWEVYAEKCYRIVREYAERPIVQVRKAVSR